MTTTTGGVRCHNPDACCAGQKPCPSPGACGVEADALELADALDHVARNVVSDRATIQRAAEALRRQHAALQPNAALAAGKDLAYREACALATTLFKKHFARKQEYASGQVVWSVCDTTAGVISQIDNMVSGLMKPSDAASLADGWISVDDRLPEPGKAVLLDIGLKTPIRAMWASKHSVEAGDECPDAWAEYDEGSDTYYCPEGWYEWNQYEETHWAVSRAAVAWMALPAPPTLNAIREVSQ